MTRSRYALLAILFAAGAMRLFNLEHGLPEVTYVDSFRFVREAARMVDAGSPRPHEFLYPTLFTYVLAAVYWLFGLHTPGALHLSGRLLAAASGTALVLATYLLARRICGRRAALLAAVLTAVCPIGITGSRFTTTDPLCALFIVVALWLLTGPSPTTRSILAAAAVIGLGTGVKYSVACTGPILAVVVILEGVRGAGLKPTLTRLVAAPLVAFAAFLCTTPYFFACLDEYAKLLRLLRVSIGTGVVGLVQGSPFDYLWSPTPVTEQPWLSTSLVGNFGVLTAACLVGALVLSLGRARTDQAELIIALHVVGLMYILVGPGKVKVIRYWMPALPPLYVLLARAWERLALGREPSSRRTAWALALGLALAAVPLTRSVAYLEKTRRPLTNTDAREWVSHNVPAGSRVFLSPFFVNDIATLPVQPVVLPEAGARQGDLPPDVGPSTERDPLYTTGLIDELRAGGVEILVMNSYFNDKLLPFPENLRYFPVSVRCYAEFCRRLEREARVELAVKGLAEGRLGPDITIWRLR